MPFALLVGACTPAQEPSTPPPSPAEAAPRPAGARVEMAYVALDGTPVTSEGLLHRLTVVGLLASYDPASQTQALYLRALAQRHRPRINVVIVVLEPPDNLPLVQAFADVLAAPFPVVLADEPTLLGRGPFGDLREVPSIVVLDREGREAWRHVGQVDLPRLDAVLGSLERGGSSPPFAPTRAMHEPGDASEPEAPSSEAE